MNLLTVFLLGLVEGEVGVSSRRRAEELRSSGVAATEPSSCGTRRAAERGDGVVAGALTGEQYRAEGGRALLVPVRHVERSR